MKRNMTIEGNPKQQRKEEHAEWQQRRDASRNAGLRLTAEQAMRDYYAKLDAKSKKSGRFRV